MSTATERLTRPTKPRGAILTPVIPPPTVSPHEIAHRSAAKAEEASRRRVADEIRRQRNRRFVRNALVLGAVLTVVVFVLRAAGIPS